MICFINTINMLLSADDDLVAGAEHGQSSQIRTAQRNGYRHRELDTRVGTLDVAMPKLRTGTYLPALAAGASQAGRSRADHRGRGLLPRRRLHPAHGSPDGRIRGPSWSTLSAATGSPRSEVSRMAGEPDEQVKTFRHRPLSEAGPVTFIAVDALTMKVREGGRVINAVVLVATGVKNDGHRECRGMQVANSETAAAWNTFFADLVTPGLSGVRLVTSDAHRGLIEAIAANLPGTAWQRCRTYYAANLMSTCPKAARPAVKAILHAVCDQPNAASVNDQFDRLLEQTSERLPEVADHLAAAREDVLAFTSFPKGIWRQIWSGPPQAGGTPQP